MRPSGVQGPARGSMSLHQVVSDSNTARVLLPLPNTVTARTVSITTSIERRGTKGSTMLTSPAMPFRAVLAARPHMTASAEMLAINRLRAA